MEWGDLRFLLEVARTGSSLQASKQLGTSQSTVTRRIDALEEALKLKLFERRAQGYVLTDQGRQLLPLAEEVEQRVTSFREWAERAKRQLVGHIRFTMPPDGGDWVFSEAVATFMRQHPQVRVEMMPTGEFLDIAGGEADVALRVGPKPEEADLIVRKVGDIVWRGCCSRSYLERYGEPKGYDQLEGHLVIGAEGLISRAEPVKRFLELVGREPDLMTASVVGFARAGAGIFVLPEGVIALSPELVSCLPPIDVLMPAWLVTRNDLRRTPHVRAFLDYMVESCRVIFAS